MLSTSSLIDSLGRAIVRDGVLPDAVNEPAGLVFVSEKGTATGLGAFTSALSVSARVDDGAGVAVVSTQARVRRLDISLTPDSSRLVPLFAQVYNGPASFYVPPDWVLPFFPTNGLPYVKRLELDDTLFPRGCFVRFSLAPLTYAEFENAATFQVISLLGLV